MFKRSVDLFEELLGEHLEVFMETESKQLKMVDANHLLRAKVGCTRFASAISTLLCPRLDQVHMFVACKAARVPSTILLFP